MNSLRAYRSTIGLTSNLWLLAGFLFLLSLASGCDSQNANSAGPAHTGAEESRISDDDRGNGNASLNPGKKPEVLIIGDSMMQFGIGPALKKSLESRGYSVQYFVKKSTGLTWTHFFDWQYKSQELLSLGQFDVIIVMLGSNDGRWLKYEGKRLHYGPDVAQWWQQYALRFDQFFGRLCNETRRVYWIGMPPMKPEGYHNKTRLFNAFYERKIQNSGCGSYIHTNYLSKEKPVRWSDGIHVSNSGGRMVADRIIKETGL